MELGVLCIMLQVTHKNIKDSECLLNVVMNIWVTSNLVLKCQLCNPDATNYINQ